MRALFGVLSLLAVVVIVALLARKQLSSVAAPPVAGSGPPATGVAAPATPQQQVEQFKQAVEGALQQPRPMPEDTK